MGINPFSIVLDCSLKVDAGGNFILAIVYELQSICDSGMGDKMQQSRSSKCRVKTAEDVASALPLHPEGIEGLRKTNLVFLHIPFSNNKKETRRFFQKHQELQDYNPLFMEIFPNQLYRLLNPSNFEAQEKDIQEMVEETNQLMLALENFYNNLSPGAYCVIKLPASTRGFGNIFLSPCENFEAFKSQLKEKLNSKIPNPDFHNLCSSDDELDMLLSSYEDSILLEECINPSLNPDTETRNTYRIAIGGYVNEDENTYEIIMDYKVVFIAIHPKFNSHQKTERLAFFDNRHYRYGPNGNHTAVEPISVKWLERRNQIENSVILNNQLSEMVKLMLLKAEKKHAHIHDNSDSFSFLKSKPYRFFDAAQEGPHNPYKTLYKVKGYITRIFSTLENENIINKVPDGVKNKINTIYFNEYMTREKVHSIKKNYITQLLRESIKYCLLNIDASSSEEKLMQKIVEILNNKRYLKVKKLILKSIFPDIPIDSFDPEVANIRDKLLLPLTIEHILQFCDRTDKTLSLSK